jgi:hypothetical protein
LPNKYLSRQQNKGTKFGGLAEVKQNFGGLAGENTENWQLAEVDIILVGLPHGSFKEKQGCHGFQTGKSSPGRIRLNEMNNRINQQLLN